MKYFHFLSIALILGPHSSIAQQKTTAAVPDTLAPLLGFYQARIIPSIRLRIKKDKNQLILEVPGQGQTAMESLGGNRFKPQQVQPASIIQFIADKNGIIEKFLWIQPTHIEWARAEDSITNGNPKDSLSAYIGHFTIKGNPYLSTELTKENGKLYFQATGEEKLELLPLARDKFIFKTAEMQLTFSFSKDKKGIIKKIITERTGGVDFVRMKDSAGSETAPAHVSNRQNGFTRADTLRGMLTAMRTCYDVSFYHLDISIHPELKSLDGSNLIRFKVKNDFDKMQIDLYANMKIEKILFHEQELSYTREADAVFLRFPTILKTGHTEEIRVYYSGVPQVPDMSIPMTGGFLWLQDQQGKLWIESVCQGSGASLWWPCKDHLSDKPDSMAISITIPSGLSDISNGRLLRKTDLPGHLTRFDWYVSYPIVNYDVVVNIGDYTHFSDIYIRSGDTLALNYYCMVYTKEKAEQLFKHVKPMLSLYEKDFGRYPFAGDGFTVMESLYPMEHQSAISIGQIDKDHFDSTEMRRLMWHESAHEWWGNSITCADIADFWIHEGFATYAEYLNREALDGKEVALAEINKQGKSANKESITGVYNVNHIHYDIGDLYSKGSLMLNTLRNVIHNDSTWFAVLQGLQDRFRYQSVSSEDITGYISQKTGMDLRYFFDQYLRQASLPELDIQWKQDKKDMVLQYKWNSAVNGFRMPVKITTARNHFNFIYPTTNWQTLRIEAMNISDFQVAKNEFYIEQKIEKSKD